MTNVNYKGMGIVDTPLSTTITSDPTTLVITTGAQITLNVTINGHNENPFNLKCNGILLTPT